MRIAWAVGIVVAVLAAGLRAADEVEKTDPELVKIRAVLDAYLTTAKHPDRPPLPKETFAKDVVAWWSNGKAYVGRPAVLATCDRANAELRNNFEEFSGTAADVVIRRSGDMAWLTCTLTLAGTLKEERGRFERKTRSTFILVKRDGTWRIVHEHSSHI